MKPFFDTNVLVYAVTADDRRSEVALGLLAAGGTISVQGLNEFASVARRKLGMDWPGIRQATEDFRMLCPDPHPLTVETHERALELAARHGFNLYDALMVSAALLAGCDLMYSEDLHDGLQVDGRLTIRNPFASDRR